LKIAASDSQLYRPFFPLPVIHIGFFIIRTIISTIVSQMQDEVFILNLVLKYVRSS
jgi:hypothetical protein